MSKATELLELVEGRLLGSAGSLEAIRSMIGDWAFSSNITLKQVGKDEWEVHNAKGLVDGVKVIQKKKRFRFEMK